MPRRQAQPHRSDHAEEAVAADDQPEELGVAISATRDHVPAGVDQRERFDVLDDRLEAESATVRVGRKRAPDRQPVGTGLLLDDPPGVLPSRLHASQLVDQLGPLDARLDLGDAALRVEADDAAHAPHVEEQRVGAELLAAHRVAGAGYADAPALAPRGRDRTPDVFDRRRLHDRADVGRVQLGVQVVHLGARFDEGAQARRAGGHRQRPGTDQEVPSLQHAVLRATARAPTNTSARATPWITW